MKQRMRFLVPILLILAGVPLLAQMSDDKEPAEALIGIYQVAPGKHLDFLRWQASQEANAKEAGVPTGQWYAHTNGASWDYLMVGPVLTDEQDRKVDEIAKKKGGKTGFKASMEFRTFISSHSDTNAIGPMSATDLFKLAEN